MVWFSLIGAWAKHQTKHAFYKECSPQLEKKLRAPKVGNSLDIVVQSERNICALNHTAVLMTQAISVWSCLTVWSLNFNINVWFIFEAAAWVLMCSSYQWNLLENSFIFNYIWPNWFMFLVALSIHILVTVCMSVGLTIKHFHDATEGALSALFKFFFVSKHELSSSFCTDFVCVYMCV